MYVGRFAPSPTGPLHAGSLVAALASWLDARAHGGRWLVRIEDVDTPRCVPGAPELILRQLAACGLHPDAPPLWQSWRGARYEAALAQLLAAGRAYPCACSRKDIEQAQAARGVARQRGAELPYPGTCRPERGGLRGRPPRAWRLHTTFESFEPPALCQQAQAAINSEAHTIPIEWCDRRLGPQRQNVAQEVGDFVLRRADGLWAYQLAVVVDDAEQGVTHVVRGQDLADNTPRQMLLQRALGVATPLYLHTPLVLAADGHKLSKQNGAAPLDVSDALSALRQAAAVLGLPDARAGTAGQALRDWIGDWRRQWCPAGA
ncbi:tRNA glutamyl-Q(34) synthetase GluQRS [Ottowia testudinis]|uniref:Glutamyl-Q tRNA(Asp) synthetase n=1 Tax=Ottowia testudinis TaxID=2816950 RepID=A0A975CIL2_9BURK|nr:tRNA glutamyl-Q(34) synthetase GluQRS [Ottowia testudinis]QTD46476.1 tRNA glutamyl-Q(34) synthetase GluQRS [Ottowia testudinis]